MDEDRNIEFICGIPTEEDVDKLANTEGKADDVTVEDDSKMYCLCGAPSTDQMIGCDDVKCPVEWYHYQCVGLTEDTIPEGKWFCDQEFSCNIYTRTRPGRIPNKIKPDIANDEQRELNYISAYPEF